MDNAALLEIFLSPIRTCAAYTPKLGQSQSYNLDEFLHLYSQDTFYSLIGLDTPLMYAAHKAAGGMTSIYRQIGVGSERLFRHIAANSLSLSTAQLDWSYNYPRSGKADGVHKLDARVRMEDVDGATQKRLTSWLKSALSIISTGQDGKYNPDGVVFEIRQGYKSADSKRQNADLRYASRANQDQLLPVVFVMSEQIGLPIIERYRREGLLVTTGLLADDPCRSSFALSQHLFKFDLLAFFKGNQKVITAEIHSVVDTLLSA